MATTVIVNPAWADIALDEGGMEIIDAHVGVPILADMKTFVPIESGALDASLGKEVVGHEIHIGSGKGGTKAEPYAARIELGFHGEDSLGRHYEQDGEPYMTPALYRERS
jgi:hypothetical protein